MIRCFDGGGISDIQQWPVYGIQLGQMSFYGPKKILGC